jgi:argininosuccinate lyase
VKFAPEYVACVLNQHFEDAKALFLVPLMAIHRAHLVMLAACGIISREDARAIRTALAAVDPAAIRAAAYDGSCEDLFFYLDRLIDATGGTGAAGRLHTARSRNDIDMTMYRMRQREWLLELMEASFELRQVLLGLAERHRETIFAAHTHTQRAQPTTIAHYLLAVVEQLERDATRFEAAYASTNRSPLGACAITGTGFPIDRTLTADLLGFDGPTGNTYGSIATADYLLESMSAAAVAVTGLGRFAQDLLLWSTAEVGYVRLGDAFVQTSSIMPQKRNPVAIEHARAIASRAIGQMSAVMLAIHNTPFGDIVDTEDDLQPVVQAAFADAARVVRLLAAAMGSAEFDAARLGARANGGWTTITELADTLVRDKGLPFRLAHAIARRVTEHAEPDSPEAAAAALADASRELAGEEITYTPNALSDLLSARRFIEVRTTVGGPAPSETARAMASSRGGLAEDRARVAARRAALHTAEERLHARLAEL